jgi:hypothetical protein
MRLLDLALRCTETAVKLPFALAWDAVRLPGIASGSESSVMKVLDEHERIKARDEREP